MPLYPRAHCRFWVFISLVSPRVSGFGMRCSVSGGGSQTLAVGAQPLYLLGFPVGEVLAWAAVARISPLSRFLPEQAEAPLVAAVSPPGAVVSGGLG